MSLNTPRQKEIIADLSLNIGTEEHHKIPFSNLVYTDGIADLIEKLNCYWLISDTAIYLSHTPSVNKEFLILRIEVTPDKKAIVTLKEDTNEPCLYTKVYDYTDFNLNDYEFYIIGGVMLLKSEY